MNFQHLQRMPQPVMEAGSLYDLVSGQIKLFESKNFKFRWKLIMVKVTM